MKERRIGSTTASNSTASSNVESHQWEVPTAAQGQRLDRWLAGSLDVSRSRLQTLIQQGNVRLNGDICYEKKTSLHVGDCLTLQIPPAVEIDLAPAAIPLDILYEDSELLVVNKPKGMVVHPSAGHTSETLVNALLAHCPHLSGIGGEQRPGIVHRLDKDTSGAIAIAKTDRAHQALQTQIQAKTARREYLGVVYGRPSESEGEVDAPIGRHPVDRKKMAVVTAEKGRHAATYWYVKEPLGNYTYLKFLLATGRTHQIRVHMAHIGHPLVGDELYCCSRTTPVKLTGQALHAWRLSFAHPISGQWIETEAPLPEEFRRLLRKLNSRYAK